MFRLKEWSVKQSIIHDLQGAAQDKCSSSHVAWLIREIITYNVENSQSVYVVLLDTRKAFDTVWQDGLFYKLYHYGLNGKTWRVLRALFTDFRCCVQLCNQLSNTFVALQGIHQGAPLSMFLYEIGGNQLLYDLNNEIYGANILKVKLACPSFADDITLLALSHEGIQQLATIAFKYSKKWRVSMKPSRCKLRVFGKDKSKKHVSVTINKKSRK